MTKTMKNILTILMATVVTINVTGQQHIVTYYDYLKKYKKEDYYLNSAGERTGKDIEYNTDGAILSISTFSGSNKMNGLCTYYYDDIGHNSIKSIGNYKNDQKDGLWKYYYSEMFSLQYQKEVLTEEFYKDGSISWKKFYNYGNKGKRFLNWEFLYKYAYNEGRYKINVGGFYKSNTGSDCADGVYEMKSYNENGKVVLDTISDNTPAVTNTKITSVESNAVQISNTPVVVTQPTIKPKPKEYPQPSPETRQNIDLMKEGKYSDVPLEWIKWMTEHCDELAPEDRLTPDDYIMYSRYKFRSEHADDAAAVLAEALKEFPDNPALQSEYDKYKNPLYQIH